jgi:Kinetochore complex Fta4 of Sim4 subunit, or CENP-50
MATPPTILDLKLAFLHEQVQTLSKSLRVPASYQPLPENDALREKSLETAMAKLNEEIRKHSRLVYSVQARRHVAEQIDTLYWQAGERDIVTGNWEGLQIGDDLSELNLNIPLFQLLFPFSSTILPHLFLIVSLRHGRKTKYLRR